MFFFLVFDGVFELHLLRSALKFNKKARPKTEVGGCFLDGLPTCTWAFVKKKMFCGPLAAGCGLCAVGCGLWAMG
jgi:hypothetical protein